MRAYWLADEEWELLFAMLAVAMSVALAAVLLV